MKNIAFRVKHIAVVSAFIFSIITAQFAGVSLAHAIGVTSTWTGGGGNSNFSTAANWSGNVLPVSGDTIKFIPLTTADNNTSTYLVNDLSGVSFGGLVQGSASTGNLAMYYINTIDFATGASVSNDSAGTIQANVAFRDMASRTGTVNAAGDLDLAAGVYTGQTLMNVVGSLTGSGQVYLRTGSSIGGNLTAIAATISSGVSIGGSITLINEALGLGFTSGDSTIANNITVGTFNSNYYLNQLAFGYCTAPAGLGASGSGPSAFSIQCGQYGTATYTLTGTLTLNADLLISVAPDSTVNINGTINYNGHTIKLTRDSTGSLNIGSTAVEIEPFTTDLSDDQPAASYSVQNKETATLYGVRASVIVSSGGILFGNGSAFDILVRDGGIIAPGHSPGKLTVKNILALGSGSTYQAQLQTSAAGGYDQIVVGNAANTSTDVIIDPTAVLNTSLYSGYNIKQGDQFTIIDNLGQAAIGGTFARLSEGTQFAVSGITFSITYKGGTGNDVVLTALNTGADPSTPNTGAQLLKLANPVVLIGLGVVTASVLFALVRRRSNQ